MKNIKSLRLTFVLLIAFFQIYDVGAQTNWPPISVRNNQNFQYSNFKFTPLAINPALAGADGLFSVSSLIGDKYNDVYRVATKQINFSTEYTFMGGFKDNDKFGIGVSVDLIRFARTNSFVFPIPNGTNYSFGAAYHYSLNAAATDFLSFGMQYNSDSRYFVESRDNLGVYPEDFVYNSPNRSNLSVGLLYKSSIGHKEKSFGIATYWLNSILPYLPNTKKLSRYGLNIHGSYDIDIYKNISIAPGFFYSNFEFSKLLNVNANVSYWINKEKMSKVYLGLGITDIDKTIVYAGGTFNGINIGIAYDWGRKTAQYYDGIRKGLELSSSYTGIAKKK
jgi:hypothetical protein